MLLFRRLTTAHVCDQGETHQGCSNNLMPFKKGLDRPAYYLPTISMGTSHSQLAVADTHQAHCDVHVPI
jgi:hypothetical protein